MKYPTKKYDYASCELCKDIQITSKKLQQYIINLEFFSTVKINSIVFNFKFKITR